MVKEKKKKSLSKKHIKKDKIKKEKICETFAIEKDGKEKVVESCGTESVKISTKDQIKHQNKILKNILLTIGFIVLGFFIILMIFYSISHFESDGVKYEIIKEKDVIFYHTSFPSNFIDAGRTIEYKLWLRNDPRELKEVPFEGNLNLLEMAVIDSEENFDCEGDGAIAIVNFNQILGAMGTHVIRDPEYSQCDGSGRYMFFDLKSGNETKIVQTGPACYDFFIKDCEVLDVTERFLVESLKAIQ